MTDTTTIDPRDPAAGPAGATEPTESRLPVEPGETAPPMPPSAQPTPPRPQPTPSPQGAASRTPLFDENATGDLRKRWSDVQAHFVDEPRSAVEQADGLVGDVMQQLSDTFKNERQSLEAQWSRGDDVSTEDLRLALQRYRSFFDRLLAL